MTPKWAGNLPFRIVFPEIACSFISNAKSPQPWKGLALLVFFSIKELLEENERMEGKQLFAEIDGQSEEPQRKRMKQDEPEETIKLSTFFLLFHQNLRSS